MAADGIPHAKAATKLFAKITAAAGTGDTLTADGLAERLIAFGVPAERSWRLFDLLDGDDDEEVTLDEFVRGFSHYTALINEFTTADGGATRLDIHQLPLECMTIVLSYLSTRPAELTAIARTSARLRSAAGADGVWAPMFRRRAWATPVHCHLSRQLEKMQGDEAGWNTVVSALQPAVREQVSCWHSWRECYRGALRWESWVVVELSTELRIGSVADASPTVFPLPYPLADAGSCLVSGTALADFICEAQPKLGIPVEGASLCVVASPLYSSALLTELAEALAHRKVHRLQFINLTVATLECARASAGVNSPISALSTADTGTAALVAGPAGTRLQSDEPPPPSGIVVIIGDEGCYVAAVAHGHQLYIPTGPSPAHMFAQVHSDSSSTADVARRSRVSLETWQPSPAVAAVAAAASTTSFLPPITALPRELAAVQEARSVVPRPGSGSAGCRDRTASKTQHRAEEVREQRRAVATVPVPSTLSLYGCAALAQDLAGVIVAAATVDQDQSVGNPKLQASDILLAIRSQLTSICYVRACPASARPVSQEERSLCRAAYEIQLHAPKFPKCGQVSGNRGQSSSLEVQKPAQLQSMGAAAASSLVRQARMQQLRVHADRLAASASASTAAHDVQVGISKRCGIARFADDRDTFRISDHSHAGSIGEPGIVVLMMKQKPALNVPMPSFRGGAKEHQKDQQQELCPSMVIELGEDRFALTEGLLYGRSIGRSYDDTHSRRAVQTAPNGGAAGVIGALCGLAEAIFGAGGAGRSLHSSDQLAALTAARQFVLAGEGALLQGLCSRISWELRHRDAGRTAAIGRMLRSAKMVALTQPGESCGRVTRNAPPVPATAEAKVQEARAVGWYGGKVHVLRVERTGGFLQKGSGGSADALRMASGRAWLTLTARPAESGSAGDGGSRRLLQPNQLAEQLKLHLRHRAGFPLPPAHF